jgi:elongin-A
MSKLSRPTHQLKGKMGQVMKAPPGMVREYQKASQPAVRILSRKHNPITKFSGGITGISGPSLEEREARLRALTSPPKKEMEGWQRTLVGSSEDDDDDFDEVDDLFDDRPSSRPQASSSHHLVHRKPPPSRTYLQQSRFSFRPPQPAARSRPQASSASPPLTRSSRIQAIRPHLLNHLKAKGTDVLSTTTHPLRPSISNRKPSTWSTKPMMPRKRTRSRHLQPRCTKKQRVR